MVPPRYAFKPELVKLLNAERGTWPSHAQIRRIFQTLRLGRSGMKTAHYTQIRAGGSGTRRDLCDLLWIYRENAHQPFSKSIESYLSRLGLLSANLSFDRLFEATTNPVESVDYMATGGMALFELFPSLWAKPSEHVAGPRTEEDVLNIASWVRTVAGRQLAGDETLSPEAANRALRDHWGDAVPCFEEQFVLYSRVIPWSVVFSGESASTKSKAFIQTGANIVLPLSEQAYRDAAAGRRFDDFREEDLQVPCHGVYLYATCETPDLGADYATRNSLITAMWQIAALSAESQARALAPAPIPSSERRLMRSGFQQVAWRETGARRMGIWEMQASWIQSFVLNSMRCVLRGDGFLDHPPQPQWD